jgi:hypothetical protein
LNKIQKGAQQTGEPKELRKMQKVLVKKSENPTRKPIKNRRKKKNTHKLSGKRPMSPRLWE